MLHIALHCTLQQEEASLSQSMIAQGSSTISKYRRAGSRPEGLKVQLEQMAVQHLYQHVAP